MIETRHRNKPIYNRCIFMKGVPRCKCDAKRNNSISTVVQNDIIRYIMNVFRHIKFTSNIKINFTTLFKRIL